MKWFAIGASSLLLTGCLVGPNYEPPQMEIPCEWHTPTSEGINEASPDYVLWWKTLKDPILDSLIERAALQNLDMQAAAARIMEARAEKKSSIADLFPYLNGSVSYNHVYFSKDAILNSILSSTVPTVPFKRNSDFFEAGFDAEWEIDLFGGLRREVRARQALLEKYEENLRDTWVSLTAEVARTYVELRGYQYRLAIIHNNIEAQSTSAHIIKDKLENGMASQLDMGRVEEQLYALQARQPLLELSKNKAIHRISILLGFPPGILYAELDPPKNLPELPYDKPIGIPSELLRRRPDIRKAERNLAADTEFIGSAVANLFPRLTLIGFIGQISTQLDTFTSSQSTAWFLSNALTFPILNAGKIVQEIKIREAKAQQSLIEYKKTVLLALEEAENAIAAFHNEMMRNYFLLKALQTNRETYKHARDLYDKGFQDYLSVTDAHRTLLASEDAYAQSKIDLLSHFVALYKALGGGWQIEAELK